MVLNLVASMTAVTPVCVGISTYVQFNLQRFGINSYGTASDGDIGHFIGASS